jgi:hypothetical protein
MPALRRTEVTRTLFVRMTGDLFGAAVSSRPTLSAVEMRSSEDHGQLKCRGGRAHCRTSARCSNGTYCCEPCDICQVSNC